MSEEKIIELLHNQLIPIVVFMVLIFILVAIILVLVIPIACDRDDEIQKKRKQKENDLEYRLIKIETALNCKASYDDLYKYIKYIEISSNNKSLKKKKK